MISKKFCGLICVLSVSLCFGVTNGFEQNDSCVCGQIYSKTGNRIVNGKLAGKGKHPWQAAVYTKKHLFLCGGSVITDRHILTAGHCINNMVTDDWYVIVGMYDQIARDGKKYRIAKWFLHEEFTDEDYAVNDIAIGVTKKKIRFHEKVWPICLNFKQDELDDLQAWTAGWGTITWKGVRPQHLHVAQVSIYGNEKCAKVLENIYNSKLMICATSYPSDACSGDSGGPLFVRSSETGMVQIGIVSFGMECGSPKSAGVYTRVSNYYEWIQKHTQDGITCSYTALNSL